MLSIRFVFFPISGTTVREVAEVDITNLRTQMKFGRNIERYKICIISGVIGPTDGRMDGHG